MMFPTRQNNGVTGCFSGVGGRVGHPLGDVFATLPLAQPGRAKPVRTKPRKSGWITTAIFSSLSGVSAAEAAAAAAKPAKLETLDHRVWQKGTLLFVE